MTAHTHQHPDVNLDCATTDHPTVQRAEVRTRFALYLATVTMFGELVVGYRTNSLALTADGWHMATHVGALGLSAAAYWYARTRAKEATFAFGTGKVYALAGYTSAALLMLVAFEMGASAVERLFSPQPISFDEALGVAVLGLLVNIISVALLWHRHDERDLAADNHRAAYLHVAADAITSLLAIAALLAGKYLHLTWTDAAVALVGGVLVFRWGLQLLRSSASQLLDMVPAAGIREQVTAAVASLGGATVRDLHLWRAVPGKVACVVTVEAKGHQRLEEFRSAILSATPIEHLTVELRHAAGEHSDHVH